MTAKFFKVFCALSLCFFYSTPSYSEDNSHGFERPDEGAINSRAVAFNSSEAVSLLSDFKEKKAEQVNALRNNINIYVPPASNVEHSKLSEKGKNSLELKKLRNEAEESVNKPLFQEGNAILPHEVLMDLPESLPDGISTINKKTDKETNFRNQKMEGLISSGPHFNSNEDGESYSSTSIRDLAPKNSLPEKEILDSSSLSDGRFSSQNNAVNPYLGQFPSSTIKSFFVAESAPLILHLQNQELNTENSGLADISQPEEDTQPASEEESDASLESEVQESENPFFLNPKSIPGEIIPETDTETLQEYEIQESPDFSEGVGGFLRSISEEGFFFSAQTDSEFSDESEDFSGVEETSALCLENPADAACQDLFIAFISQPLLLESTPSAEEEGIAFENFALIGEENDSLMMESSLIPEETESASFALSSGTDSGEANADQNNKKGSASDKSSKNFAISGESVQINEQGPAVEVPLGMPDFYLPWQRAVLHDSKFVKVDPPAFQKTEPESLSKIQARVAPENSLYNVMPKFSSEDTQKNSKNTAEDNPLDMDFDFPLKSVFERPLPPAFPIKAMIKPQHNIQVSPISSYQIQDVPTEWQIYEWFFEFCTDLYYYDWNWMLWLNQEEGRFLRKLDS